MGPKRDQITPREDRVLGGTDHPSGPDDLHPGEIEGSVETLPPAEGRDALEGALAAEDAEEERE